MKKGIYLLVIALFICLVFGIQYLIYRIKLNNIFRMYDSFSISQHNITTDHIERPIHFWHTADEITLALLKNQPQLKIIDVFINTQVSGAYRINYYDSRSIRGMHEVLKKQNNLNPGEKQIRLHSAVYRNKNFHKMMEYPNVIMYDYYKEIGFNENIFNDNLAKYDNLIGIQCKDFPYIKGKYRIIMHSNDKYTIFFEYNGIQMKEYLQTREHLTKLDLYREITFKELQNIDSGLFYAFLISDKIL